MRSGPPEIPQAIGRLDAITRRLREECPEAEYVVAADDKSWGKARGKAEGAGVGSRRGEGALTVLVEGARGEVRELRGEA